MSWDFLYLGILTSLNTDPKQNSSISGIVWSFLLAFVHAKLLSHVWLFVTPWTVAHQAPLSMGFPRQEYWSEFPFPPPEDLPDPRIEPKSLISTALRGRFFTTSTTWETRVALNHFVYLPKYCIRLLAVFPKPNASFFVFNL